MEVPYTSIKLFCCQNTFVNFRQLSVQVEDYLSNSFSFPCGRKTFRQLLSTFCEAKRPPVRLRQISVLWVDFLSTSVNIPCGQEMLRQLFVRPGDLPSTSVNISYDCRIIFEASSTSHAARRPYVSFCLLSVRPEDLPSTFYATRRPSINLSQLSVLPGHLLQTSFNFLCNWESFRSLLSTFCASARPSINFLCGSVTFHQLPLTFCADGRSFVNFHQYSVAPGDLLSPSIKFQGCQEIFCQFPSTF